MRATTVLPFIALWPLALAVAACAPATVPERIPLPQTAAAEDLASCGGAGLVRYVGHPLVRPEFPVPAEGAYVTTRDLPPKTRVLGPRDMATMDFVPDRLTIVLDANDRIRRLYCG